MELDFGGLGKQYAADRAALVCLDAGLEHGLIDLGGDIRVIGPHPDGHPWDIGIRHPRRPGDLLTSAQLSAGALATAGDYHRSIEIDGRHYAHILNPQTGWPVMGLSSISVIAEDCLLAGTLSTIAMLKGMQGPPWLKSLKLAHVWMDLQGDFGQSFLAARPLKIPSQLNCLPGFAGVISRFSRCKRKSLLRLFQEMFDHRNHPLLF